MKSSIRTVALSAFVIFASLSQPLRAQTKALQAQMNVPFAFDYGTKHLAPGAYTIDLQHRNLLILRGASGAVMAMVRDEANNRPVKTGRAVFAKYGDRVFLDEVWVAGNATHLDVCHAKPKQHAEGYASSIAAPAQVEVAILSIPGAPGN